MVKRFFYLYDHYYGGGKGQHLPFVSDLHIYIIGSWDNYYN